MAGSSSLLASIARESDGRLAARKLRIEPSAPSRGGRIAPAASCRASAARANRVQGMALSRAAGIGLPVSSHTPYVPVRMRLRAASISCNASCSAVNIASATL